MGIWVLPLAGSLHLRGAVLKGWLVHFYQDLVLKPRHFVFLSNPLKGYLTYNKTHPPRTLT